MPRDGIMVEPGAEHGFFHITGAIMLPDADAFTFTILVNQAT